MANNNIRLFGAILIAFFVLDFFQVTVSVSTAQGDERIDSTWFCGGNYPRKLSEKYCWKRFAGFKGLARGEAVSLREEAAAPPPPQHSLPPP
ncbi:hypothetical protein ABFS83_05G020500 [Erythranthe nasuta]